MVFYEYFYICLHGRIKTSKQIMLPIISSITVIRKGSNHSPVYFYKDRSFLRLFKYLFQIQAKPI